MTDPAAKLREDRALRKAARELLDSDIAFIKEGLAMRSIPMRIVDRATSGAGDVAGEASKLVEENSGKLAAGAAIGAACAVGWIYRAPILDTAQRLLARLNRKEPMA